MRKFYSLALLFVASVFCSTAYGYTGKEDITSSKLTNADFSAMTPVAQSVRTYAKDLADNGAGSDGADLYGMQPVNGWTASNPTDNIKRTATDDRDAKASGIFPVYDALAIDEEENPVGLGGAYYGIGEAGKTALGLVAVWTASLTYTQDVTLPAGAYIIVTTLYNAAGTGSLTNKIGFVSADKSFYSDSTTYQVGVWEKDTVYVELDAETAGQISLGYQSANIGSGSAPHIFIDNVKIFTVDAAEAEAQKIAEAKAQLLDLIKIGKVYNVDTTASEAVYNNASATLAEVEAAIEAQTKINDSGVTDLSAYFIVNSHFDLDEPLEGGICTYDYDCAKNNIPLTNYSMLPVTGWERTKTDNGAASGVYAIGSGAFLGGADYKVPDVMSDGSSEGKVLGFVTCWGMSMQYKQAVTLPAGDYTLTMSYYNTGGTTAIVKNLIGFVSDDGKEYLSDNLTFPVGTWTKDEIKFTLNEETTGYFSLGYQSAGVGSGSMPHFFTDGISLVYVGSGIDPSMFALKAAVSGANKILASGDPFYTVTEENLTKAVEAAQALIDAESADTDANQAAYEVLSALVSEANASIAAYKKLSDFMNEGGDFAIARALYTSEAGYTNTSAALDAIEDKAGTALFDYNLSTEEINEMIASLDEAIKTGLQADWEALIESGESLENGLDISALLENIGENGNFTGWTSTNGSIGIEHNVAQIYDKSPFKVSQILKDLPKGKYTVATRGFYRIGANDVNIDAYNTGGTTGAYVFAGSNKSPMANVAVVTFETAEDYTGLAAAGDVFVINNREGASKIFNDPEYVENFVTSASTVLTEDGDLTFGVTADELQATSWVTWYEFSILYHGAATAEDLHTELAGVIEELTATSAALETYAGENGDYITTPVVTEISSANDNASDVIDAAEAINDDSEDAAALTDAINKVKAEIEKIEAVQALAEANVKAVTECKDAAIALDEFLNNEISEYNPSQDALEAATSLLNDEADDDAIASLTTEEVEALTVRLQEAISTLKIPADANKATDDKPVNMTDVIANADIEQGGTVAWKYTKNGGNGPALAAGIEGQSLEFWNSTAANLQFNIWQDLVSLPAGKYELTADAANCLVSNSTNNPDAEGRAFLYAATFTADSDTTYFSSEPVALQEEQCTEKWNNYSVIFTVNEGEKVSVGFKTSGTMAAGWFVADNFKLMYFGTESTKEDSGNPMSVEGIDAPEAAAVVAIYTVSGAPAAELQKGLNIVKYADGSTKKIFVK